MSKKSLTKKIPQPTLTYHPSRDPVYTTGAFIQPVSYVGSDGETVFGWIVTEFEDDTYRDGECLNIEVSADNLAGLTPEDEEEEEDENAKISKEKSKNNISHFLVDYNIRYVELDTPFKSSLGRITAARLNGFEIEYGEDTGDYDSLRANELYELAYEIEQQILTDEKAFQRSQS